MITKFLVLILCFNVYVYIEPHIRRLLYNRRASKCGASPIQMSDIRYPMGIPIVIEISWAVINKRLIDHIRGIFQDGKVKTICGYALGNFSVLTCDPENVKAMLSTQFKDFILGDRHEEVGPLLGDGIFTLDGEGWSHSRALLRPQFTRQQVSRLDSIEVHARKIIDIATSNFNSPRTKDKLFDIQDVFYRFTLDSSTEFLFGESTNSLDDNPTSDSMQFSDAFNKAQNYLANKEWQIFINYWKFKTWTKICQDFVDNYVNKALDGKISRREDHYVFLHALAQQTREPIVLRSQCLNILLAGRDTTAAALSFCIYTLARYPHYFDKLRQMVLEQFGAEIEQISFESLKRFTFLQHFISEVLRMYPIIPNNSRMAVVDTTLPRGGGPDGMSPILIEKGSKVVYSVCAMHRLKEFYGEDAEEFRPERWEGKVLSWEFLPFNGGPRICLGQQLALTEISYVLVRLLQSFKEIITTADRISGEPTQNTSLTVSVRKGVYVNLVPT